jgi:hypothetical protein
MHFSPSRPDVIRSVRHRWLVNHWERLRGSANVPLWSALDVDDLSRMVENMQFCDVVSSGGRNRFLVRFCGARIVQVYGECNDQFLDDKLPPLLRDATIAVYSKAVSAGQPVYTICRVPDGDGKPVDFERLLLPFARDGSTVDRVLTMLEWVSIEGGFESKRLLRSQAQAPVYSVCATIEHFVAQPVARSG